MVIPLSFPKLKDDMHMSIDLLGKSEKITEQFSREAHFHQNLEKLNLIAQEILSSITHNSRTINHLPYNNNKENQFLLYIYYLNLEKERNGKIALYYLEKAANDGHQLAQSTLGFEYALGRHVEKNYQQAMFWHERAIKKHKIPNKNSLFWIGSSYWLRIGNITDDQLAIQYLAKAANSKHSHAALLLGYIFTKGYEGIPINSKKGCHYFSIAAEAGVVEAQIMLAKHLFFGWGEIEVNYKQALYWFTNAASDPIAQYYIGRIHLEGLGVNKNVELALNYFQQSANQGDKDSETSAAWILIHSAKDVKTGIEKLKKLSEQKHRPAALMLGMFWMGKNCPAIPKNLDQAIHYLTIAADLGDAKACRILSNIYLQEKNDEDLAIEWLRESINLEEDGETLYRLSILLLQCHDEQTIMEDFGLRKEIIDYLTRAADLKVASAQDTLAVYYLNGYLVQKNPEKGIALLEEVGSPEATLQLAFCYKDGIGVKKDIHQSIFFFNKATVENQNIEVTQVAEYWLSSIYSRLFKI